MNRSLPILILLGLTATCARADMSDVTIALGNATVDAGGTGTLDISITSSQGLPLSAYSLELLITPVPGATSFLQFDSNQTEPTGDPNYVFAGHSFAYDYNSTVFLYPYGTNYQGDTIIVADQYDNPSTGFVYLPTAPGGLNSYLATVAFQAPIGATAGDQFQVTLVDDPNQTFFDDDGGNPYSTYSSSGGLVTVDSAVPEPTSLTMLAMSSLGGLLWQRHRRGRRRAASRLVQVAK